jgi:DNA primase
VNGHIDTDEVNRRVNLLGLAMGVTDLGSRPVASTGGGEWAGRCPFCGGTDRFRVQPNQQPHGIWMCRHCTDGKWCDPIEFGRRLWPSMAFPELCKTLAGGNLPTSTAPAPTPAPRPAAAAPGDDWQTAARQVMEETTAALWQPKYTKVLDYLHARGLVDDTIKRFGLGYCATGRANQYGREIAGVYVPRGIVIPCTERESIWYLKIRLMPGVPCSCSHCHKPMAGPGRCPNCDKSTKYTGVKGNRTVAIFNADMLDSADIALFCEGEFDCMLAWQGLGDLLPVATLGAATNSRPDLAHWGRYFIGKRATLLSYDLDGAGEQGAAALAELASFPVWAPLPAGQWKDITDLYTSGGDLRGWIAPYLEQFDPVPANWQEWASGAGAGVHPVES